MKKIYLCVLIAIFLTNIFFYFTSLKKDNNQKVEKYISQVISHNNYKNKSFDIVEFSWDKEKSKNKWKYYNGYLMFALLQIKKYDDFVKKFYNDNISFDGKVNNLNNASNIYKKNELDSILPAYTLLYLNDNKYNKFNKFIQSIYEDLKEQPTLKKCGNNFKHKVNNINWNKYPFALDGLYMALPFYLEYSKDYKETFKRLNWVANNLKLENGLYSHGVSENGNDKNNVVWLRALGWYAMAQVDIIEKFPESKEKRILVSQLKIFFDKIIQEQDPNTGMWLNILYPKTIDKCNKLETSGTLMLAYSLLKAYRLGYLKEEKYKYAGIKAFNGTISNKLHKNTFGQFYLSDIYLSSSVYEDAKNYCNCKKYVNDDAKGFASLILAFSEIEKLNMKTNI